MAETWLRDLLERAAGDGPPTSPAAAARNALWAGVRLRRRRRAQRAAAGAVVVVVACAAAFAVTGQDGNRAATPAREAGTVYVLGDQWNTHRKLAFAADAVGTYGPGHDRRRAAFASRARTSVMSSL
jgi:hypothetical protein